jgi:hypothetical protein
MIYDTVLSTDCNEISLISVCFLLANKWMNVGTSPYVKVNVPKLFFSPFTTRSVTHITTQGHFNPWENFPAAPYSKAYFTEKIN